MAIRREKTDFTTAKKKVDDLQKRVSENQEKLKRNCQLPYMVANVGEILQPDEDDDEQEKAGSGFSAKKQNDNLQAQRGKRGKCGKQGPCVSVTVSGAMREPSLEKGGALVQVQESPLECGASDASVSASVSANVSWSGSGRGRGSGSETGLSSNKGAGTLHGVAAWSPDAPITNTCSSSLTFGAALREAS